METVKLFLFETYNEISGNTDCSKKIKTEKQKTLNFFFSVAHFGLVEPKSGWFWHVWNIFVKIFGVNLEFLKIATLWRKKNSD